MALLVTTLFPGLSGFFERRPDYWLNVDFIVLLKVTFKGFSWFTEKLFCINYSNFSLSYFSNNINSDLGFGIHQNHPLLSSSIKKRIILKH